MASKNHKTDHSKWKLVTGLFLRNKGTAEEYFHGTYLGNEPVTIEPGMKLRIYSNRRKGSKPANEPTHFLNIEES